MIKEHIMNYGGVYAKGNPGTSGSGRQTGGGGSGSAYTIHDYVFGAAGGRGTSYSGGTGGGGMQYHAGYSPTAGSSNGGAGGNSDKNASGTTYGTTGGAGNPGGKNGASNGTGGLLIIYADEYDNNGNITATGARGGSASISAGGSSGGGSINIFTNQPTNIDKLGIVIDEKYNSILGNTTFSGGASSSVNGGAGGLGTVNIGGIRNAQYYDLKEIIQQDIDSYIESLTIKGESILQILHDNEDLKTGYYTFSVNDQTYPVHLYVFDEDQTWNSMTFGDANDVATSSVFAKNMVIVKVNGDLTINSRATIKPYYNSYGGLHIICNRKTN